MGWNPPPPPPQRLSVPGSCEGCGAPLQRHEWQCSYCLRATGNEVERLDVTCLEDTVRRVGVLTVNEARRALGLRPTRQPPKERDDWA